MKQFTITRLLFTLALCAATLGQPLAAQSERVSSGQTRAEQGKIRTLLDDARTDLDTVPGYLQSQLYTGAEVILLRAQGRLKQAQALLDAHPEMIQRSVNWMGFSPQSLRDELTESYREVRNRFLEIEKQSVALMKDFSRLNPTSQLGYRTELIGYFESLLNNIEDPALRAEFEAILDKIRRAIQNNDLSALQAAFDEAFGFLRDKGESIKSIDLPTVPSLPATMANWTSFLDEIKERILSVRESNPEVYAELWAKYNLLVQAVGREDEESSRRLANEIIERLRGLGVTTPSLPTDPDSNRRTDLTPTPQLPAALDSSSMSGEGKALTDFYNDAINRAVELSPANQARVARLLNQLRDAIARGDWEEARRLRGEIEEVFRSEGKAPPGPSANVEKTPSPFTKSNGTIRFVDPVTGEEILFPADLTRPGISRRYIGGEGARLVEEQKQFLEESGDTFVRRVGEVRQWDFHVEQDETAVDFVEDGLQSKLIFKDRSGNTGYRVSGWKVTHAGSGRVVATGDTGRELDLVFTEPGNYRVEVQGTTEWESNFRIEAQIEILYTAL